MRCFADSPRFPFASPPMPPLVGWRRVVHSADLPVLRSVEFVAWFGSRALTVLSEAAMALCMS
jgi:hypothetical protein